MAKIFTVTTINSTATIVQFSTSMTTAMLQMANAAVGSYAGNSTNGNTFVENFLGLVVAEGLRIAADTQVPAPGTMATAGITSSYLYTNVKANSE